jgi:hypothetical protein
LKGWPACCCIQLCPSRTPQLRFTTLIQCKTAWTLDPGQVFVGKIPPGNEQACSRSCNRKNTLLNAIAFRRCAGGTYRSGRSACTCIHRLTRARMNIYACKTHVYTAVRNASKHVHSCTHYTHVQLPMHSSLHDTALPLHTGGSASHLERYTYAKMTDTLSHTRCIRVQIRVTYTSEFECIHVHTNTL